MSAGADLPVPAAPGGYAAVLGAPAAGGFAWNRTPWGIAATDATYGAIPDLVRLGDAAITGGQAVLTSATASFAAADVGKPIVVQGAGTAGAALATTILSRQSATQVTLSVNASTTVSGADARYGTDNTAAIQAALSAAGVVGALLSGGDYSGNGGSTVVLPPGVYGYTGVLFVPHLVKLRGAGHDATALVSLAANAHMRFANISGNTLTSLNTTLQQGGSLTYPLSGATLTVKDNPQTGGAFPPPGAAFTATGSLTIGVGATAQTVTYTGVTATGFTGVSGGTSGVVHTDGQPITQGSTSGRRGGIGGGFTLDGNNVSTPNGYLLLWGRSIQSGLDDVFVENSAGGGVLCATAQNNWFVQMQVQKNAGDGWTWDYGAGGNQRVKCEINNNGSGGGYNEKSIESGASCVSGYKQPTNNQTLATIFERSTDGLSGDSYFGAGVDNIYTDCNFASSVSTTLTAQAALPAATLALANASRFPSAGGTATVTDGTNTDNITYTGKTGNTLTGVTGGTHTYAATITTVSLTSPKRSMLTFRVDNTNGSTLSSQWKFHNCIIQGQQGLTYAIDALGAVSVVFTGQTNIKIHDVTWYVDDTAQIQGSVRESTFNTSFLTQGGVKTKDQVVRPTGSAALTTQGVPNDGLVQTNPPPQDGAVAVDNVNGDFYFRALVGNWTRAARAAELQTALSAANGLSAGLGSCDIRDITSTAIVLAASGSDTLVGIYIPKGFVVSSLKWRSGGTAATFGSNADGHWYLVIRNQAGALMASTADQGTTAIASGSIITKAIARDSANGAASTWTSPASAWYLAGPNIYVGTGGAPVMPTASGKAPLVSSLLNNVDSLVSATGQTGVTSGTPATAPGAPVIATVQPWVAVV